MNLKTQFTSMEITVVIGGKFAHLGHLFLHFPADPLRARTSRRRHDGGQAWGRLPRLEDARTPPNLPEKAYFWDEQ